MKNTVLNSTEIQYRDKFVWEVKIIQRDDVLNAFCTPGGYIYVYTGLIKYLESEDQLIGVMGHEIAHADKRHSKDQLVAQYGIQVLLDIILGENQGTLTEIGKNLLTLKNSRSAESEADEFSVRYLCPTTYNAAGSAGFFEKLIREGKGGGDLEFLSTHPSPDNRVENINNKRTELGCSGTTINQSQYQAFKAKLP